MIWLLLSILCSTLLIFIFRLFPVYRIHTFQAIVFNYIICTILGILVQYNRVQVDLELEWLILSIIHGAIFISLFFLIAITAQKMGITIATVAMKLGMVAPVAIGIIFFKESNTFLKLAGIFFAIVAVVLSSWRREPTHDKINASHLKWFAVLPFIVFIGSGISDSIVQLTEQFFFPEGGFESFIIVLFGTAASIGILLLFYQLVKNKTNLRMRNVWAGIILGVPNYGSIYFLFKTLNESRMESSVIFPVNNIGIVSAATIGAVVFFSERLNIHNKLGVICTLLAIILISLS